jgi:hypothetical protein
VGRLIETVLIKIRYQVKKSEELKGKMLNAKEKYEGPKKKVKYVV